MNINEDDFSTKINTLSSLINVRNYISMMTNGVSKHVDKKALNAMFDKLKKLDSIIIASINNMEE